MKQTLHVRAIIKQEDVKILLLRRATGNPAYRGLFELPGGKVGFGEDPKSALIREIQEETGREVESLHVYDVHSDVDSLDSQHQYVVISFSVILKPETLITLSNEHDKYVWKSLSEIQLKEVTETTARVLELVESDEATPDIYQKSIVHETTKVDELFINADGGSRGNPGPSAAGFVMKDSSERLIFEGGKYLGVTTNNQAEYYAVRLALEKAREYAAKKVTFRLDSQLVVNQLNGLYQVRNRDLWPIYAYIKDLTQHFKEVIFTHVRREFNKEADAMVNKVLDEHSGRRA